MRAFEKWYNPFFRSKMRSKCGRKFDKETWISWAKRKGITLPEKIDKNKLNSFRI